MKIVVSDTSPINYLILIDEADLLTVLFREIYVPPRVAAELRSPMAPLKVRQWMAATPAWLQIRMPIQVLSEPRLDPGEIEAISLAREIKANHLLIDEWKGRQVATGFGLNVIGTLGILDQAAARNIIALASAVDRLKRTSYRIDEAIVNRLLQVDALRRAGSGP